MNHDASRNQHRSSSDDPRIEPSAGDLGRDLPRSLPRIVRRAIRRGRNTSRLARDVAALAEQVSGPGPATARLAQTTGREQWIAAVCCRIRELLRGESNTRDVVTSLRLLETDRCPQTQLIRTA